MTCIQIEKRAQVQNFILFANRQGNQAYVTTIQKRIQGIDTFINQEYWKNTQMEVKLCVCRQELICVAIDYLQCYKIAQRQCQQ